ncbi:Spy/CpxP family protein refolding chaperone [Pedobacter cryophilus]|uniref:Uncharacterized protein n=1 Tax=Pedobacter cryophilus TaxID=2571271 RepID=A0A4U1BWV3_9SPHI|nr:Spy/CpxP family protein refolding chaperone [Pedobacter cryophilus]TKB96824.1 hypothetical protein FA046_12125 [Pedobacter cryophilus]
MKKIIGMILFLGLGFGSYAQQDSMKHKKMMMHQKDSMKMGGMMKMHQPNFDKLKTDLGLTDKQVADWKKMEESMKPEMDKMHEKHMAEMEAMHEKHQAEMEKMKNQKNEQLKSILTKDQYEKFLKSHPKLGDKKMMPRDGKKGPPPPPKN